MLSKGVVYLILFAGLALLTLPAAAQVLNVEGQLDQGLRAYNAGDYNNALQIFQAGYENLSSRQENVVGLDRILFQIILTQMKMEEWDGVHNSSQRYLKNHSGAQHHEMAAFLMAVASLQMRDVPQAAADFQNFASGFPQSPLAGRATLLSAMLLVKSGDYEKSVTPISSAIDRFSGAMRSQAELTLLRARQGARDFEGAARLVLTHDAEARDQVHLAGFHQSALQLAAQLTDEGDDRSALRVLQNIPGREELVARTEVHIEAVDALLKASVVATLRDTLAYQFAEAALNQAREEVDTLRSVEDFDIARMLRLADSYLNLGLDHEAAIVLREFLNSHDSSDTIEAAFMQYLGCLSRMESWPVLIQAGNEFEDRFPESTQLPEALYLVGEAQMRVNQNEEAVLTFTRIVESFLDASVGPRADFLRGYLLVVLGDNEKAITILDSHNGRFTKTPHRADSELWAAMARFYSKDYDSAREAFTGFLERHPASDQASEAAFRRTQCLFNQRRFKEVPPEVEAFLVTYPDAGQRDDVRNMMADSFLAIGEVDAAVEAYEAIPITSGSAFDYAYFRRGKIIEALEDRQATEPHFKKFLELRPDSGRVPEAISMLAAISSERGEVSQAKDIYWQAIRKYGNNPENDSVDELFRGLQRVFERAGELDEFSTRLNELAVDARQSKSPTLAARAKWMQANLLSTRHPEQAVKLLLEIGDETKPVDLSVTTLVSVADALRASGEIAKAREFYQTILAWYPRSFYINQAYAGLAFLALAEGDEEEALRRFAQFRNEVSPLPLRKKVALAEAGIFEHRGDHTHAASILEDLLPELRGRDAAETLHQLGRIYSAGGEHRKAIAFFQRIYIAHGRWPQFVAGAYLGSGLSFEALGMQDEARRTYEEFLEIPELAEMPEFEQARSRLAGLPEPAVKRES